MIRATESSTTVDKDSYMNLKMEIPTGVRDFAEMSIAQAEKAFGAFIRAANESATMMPNPTAEISKKALSFTEQNMRTAVDHIRNLIRARDVHEAVRLQTEFLQAQFAAITKLYGGGALSAAKDASAG